VLHQRPVASGRLLDLHGANPERYPVLLESAAGGTPLGRYDLLLAFPGQCVVLHGDSRVEGAAGGAGRDFLRTLDQWWSAARLPLERCGLPFVGGWFLFLGYELAAEIEPSLDLPRDPRRLIAVAMRIPAVILRDTATGLGWLVAEPDGLAGERIEAMAADLAQVTTADCSPYDQLMQGQIEEEDPAQFLAAVMQALEYIRAGDVYQANLSRAWSAWLRPDVTAAQVYARLRQSNPGPFAGIARLADCTVISSSPERLVTCGDGRVSTRPIAGTRSRGPDPAADLALARELHANAKERAEHIMLIDLERNDLGRICTAGSVRVDELMVIESYAHVHHIVSNVTGRLRTGVTPGQIIGAVFPGGTITGCPKVRCMELIGELERMPRGSYTGSMGYLGHDGSLDLNILIRTFEQQGRCLQLRAGAGIVADSVPERELDETRAKALGLLRALDCKVAVS